MSNRAKNFLILFFSALLVYSIAFGLVSFFYSPNGNKIVYITDTGECYHTSGCSSLKYSRHKQTLQEAVDLGYRFCNNCDPAELIPDDYDLEISWKLILFLLLPTAYIGMAASVFVSLLLDLLFRIDPYEYKSSVLFAQFTIMSVFFLASLDAFL